MCAERNEETLGNEMKLGEREGRTGNNLALILFLGVILRLSFKEEIFLGRLG